MCVNIRPPDEQHGSDVCKYPGDVTHPMNNRMMKVMRKRWKIQTKSKVAKMWKRKAEAYWMGVNFTALSMACCRATRG